MPLPCVPVASAQKTLSKSGQALELADYTPATSPMVPALVVHCINEIEARGLGEVGLFRIPGSEREVRDLKEKFLAGRGYPKLYHLDVHTLTGVVKDFLRSLQQPLIPTYMWHLFTQAASNPDTTDGESELYQVLFKGCQFISKIEIFKLITYYLRVASLLVKLRYLNSLRIA